MASDAVNRKFAVGRDNAGNGAKQPHLLSEAEASALRSAHDRSDGMMLWSYDFSSKKLRIYGVVPQKILHQGVAPSNSFAVRRALGKVGFKAISTQIKALSAANSHGGCYFSLVAGSEINDFYFRAYAEFGPSGKMVGLSGAITYLERLSDQQTNQSSEFFKSLLRAADVAFWSWNPKTNELDYDRKWYDRIALAGRDGNTIANWMAAMHPSDAIQVAEDIRAHLEGRTEIYVARMRLLGLDGKYKQIVSRGKIIERNALGEPTRFSGIHIDLSEPEMLKATIEKQNKSLAGKADLEIQATIAKGAAHDLRNALNFINGSLSMTRTLIAQRENVPDQNEAFARALSIMETGVAVAIKVVHSLERPERGGASDFRDFALERAVSAAVELVKTRVGQAKILALIPNEIVVHGSFEGICQIVMNLLINASDAIGGTQGTINITAVETDKKGSHWVDLQIADSGSGMTRETQDKLFDPFYTTKKQGEGTGLGLYIVKNEAERHGGFVTCESEIGVGSTFVIRLPGSFRTSDRVI